MDSRGDGEFATVQLEDSPIGAFVTTDQGEIVEVNRAACELLGYSREALLGRSVATVDVDSADSRLLSWLGQVGADHVASERQFQHSDGHTVDVRLEAGPLAEDRLLVCCQDITERKRAARRLEESEASYRSMAQALDTSSVGTFILDSDCTVVWVSQAVETFFGIDRDQLRGKHKPTVIEESIKDIFEKPARFAETVLASYEANSYVESFTCHVLPAEGREERWLTHWSAPIETGLYAGGRIEHYTDITDSVDYERTLEQQRDNLRILNEVMRHDIRNDLQLVIAYADLLADHVDGEAEAFLETILESAADAVELTKTAGETAEVMLTTDAEPQQIGLRTVLTSTMDEIQAANPGAVITGKAEIPAVTVHADDLLGSVFRNLLSNAIRHNDETVPEVTVSASVRDDTVQVRVADNGPGVPEDRREEIFGKGQKGLDSQGTGLGLYLVTTLVDRYGGSVGVETNDSDGATFVVELPTA